MMNKMTICLALTVLCLLKVSASSANNPDAFELLDKYAATQEKTQSFIMKVEVAQKGKATSYKNVSMEMFSSSEDRFDGKRFSSRSTSWGEINPKMTLEKEEAFYKSFLWDGKDFYQYDRTANEDKGHLIIRQYSGNYDEIAPRGTPMIAHSLIASTKGYFPQEADNIDMILRNATSLSVRDKKEKIGESSCYVIEAKAQSGRYKIWIDPEHSYQIAKAEVRKGPGDVVFASKYKLPENDHIRTSVNNVRFEKKGDVWIPVEWQTKLSRKHPSGDLLTQTTDVKITECELNPDHELLKSFIPNDIINGAKVRIGKGGKKVFIPITYIWQDGELIPNIDELVIDQLDKMAEEIMADKGSSGTKSESELSHAGLTVSQLLKKYRATQNKLQSFIAKGESLIEYVNKTRQSNRKETEHCEFRFDGNRVNHRSTFWDGLFTTKERPGYKSFLWDGKSFIEYRRAEELKNSRVFVKKHDLSKKRVIATEYKGAALMGICGGDYDRIDLILGKAEKISLRDKTDKIEESDCFVIDAKTKRGKYTVWFDPQHGCNIAKIEVQGEKDDLVRDRESVKTGMSFSLENVRFEKIGDVWVPMEADMQQTEDSGAKITKWHHKRTEMILNPDHDVVGSFLANDIPDGIKVIFPGRFDKTAYVWQNGKPVTEAKSNVEP